MKRLSTILSCLLLNVAVLFANAQSGGYYPRGGPDIQAEDVSLIQLIANPQAYDQKIVRVIGFLHLEFEGDALYLHSDDFTYAVTKNALWINIPKGMTQTQRNTVNNQYVICTGMFVANMHGHMGLNSGEIDQITRLQIWMPYPKSIQK